MLRFYDIHAHLADSRVVGQAAEILATARQAGVAGILVNAARHAEWPAVMRLCAEPGVSGALGVHPFFLDGWTDQTAEQLRRCLCECPGIRAIGEIGLDFYHGRADADAQLAVFTAQLRLAQDVGLPVVLHNRRAWPEFMHVLKEQGLAQLRGVCHHFNGSIELARELLDRGLYLSFCGPLTYENAVHLKQAAEYVPLSRILTETDTPDLPVASQRHGESRPWHVAEIVREIARLKNCPVETVCEHVEENFQRLLSGG